MLAARRSRDAQMEGSCSAGPTTQQQLDPCQHKGSAAMLSLHSGGQLTAYRYLTYALGLSTREKMLLQSRIILTVQQSELCQRWRGGNSGQLAAFTAHFSSPLPMMLWDRAVLWEQEHSCCFKPGEEPGWTRRVMDSLCCGGTGQRSTWIFSPSCLLQI